MATMQRLKERGGAGGKITALRSPDAFVERSLKSGSGGGVGSGRKVAGKENPRSVSRGRAPMLTTQKRAVLQHPMPIQRIDKAVAAGFGSSRKEGVRWSASSVVTRGKSPDPSKFARFLSDMRSDRMSLGAGFDKPVMDGSCRGKGLNGFRVEKGPEKRASLGSGSSAMEEKFGVSSRVLESARNRTSIELKLKEMVKSDCRYLNYKKDRIFTYNNEQGDVETDANGPKSSDSSKDKFCLDELAPCLTGVSQKDLNAATNLEDEKLLESKRKCSGNSDVGGAMLVADVNGKPANDVGKISDISASSSVQVADKSKTCSDDGVLRGFKDSVGTHSDIEVAAYKSLSKVGGTQDLKENGYSEASDRPEGNKYPSKLRERLAYLEGRVSKIASEIKRTKDMLDLNNPESSKLVLSDIHEKIKGSEKVVNIVVVDSNCKLRMPEIALNGGVPLEDEEAKQSEQSCAIKRPVNGMNLEELEMRFYPHQKLLKSQGRVGILAEKKWTNVQESSETSHLVDQLLAPTVENPISVKFLASLDDNLSKIKVNDSKSQLEYTMRQAAESGTSEACDKQFTLKNTEIEKSGVDESLRANETLADFDEENRIDMSFQEMPQDSLSDQIMEIGCKSATGGWFVSEGESVLLAHGDGSCTFYDITNSEEKSVYKPPPGLSYNIWGDCWLIRAPGSDGCCGRYVVAASAGNTLDSGFCSWDFYTKDIQAFHGEDGTRTSNYSSRTVLGTLADSDIQRSSLLQNLSPQNQQCWYRPCGPLMICTATCQKSVNIYDIRDGEFVMKWEVQKPVLTMDYSSPLQWRSKGKTVIAETEGISLWDVNSLNPQSLFTVSSMGKKISALHVNNTDGDLGGGVRQRVSSSEAEGNDGVFSTQENVNILDFRVPSGIGLKINKHGTSNNSAIYSRGDAILLGGTDPKLATKRGIRSHVQQFSLREGRLQATYALPESGAHSYHSSIAQVWGNSQYVMGICGLGLFVFDTFKEGLSSSSIYQGDAREVSEVIGPDDLYSPSFDYLASRALIISRDRPALWRYL